MENRRTFLGIAAAALLPIGIDAQTAAQTAAQTPVPARPELARHALTGPFEGFEAVLIRVDPPAGQPVAATRGPGHRHSGFVVG